MKYLVLLTILSTVLISLCTVPNFPFQLPVVSSQTQQTSSVLTIDSGSPDIYVSAGTTSLQTRPGREFQIYFELRDKQTYDLKNVKLEFYDHPCFTAGTFSNDVGTVRANQSKYITFKWNTDSNIDLQKKCPIRFKISYDSSYSYFQDVAVLSSNEYYQRESEGTLHNLPLSSSSTSSPLCVQITFSDDQPFLANQPNHYMYINYKNNGDGNFDSLNIILTPPSNINLDCYPYYDNSFNLVKSLVFIRNQATPSTCKFSTKDVAMMDIKSLGLTANYKYVLDNSILVTVNP